MLYTGVILEILLSGFQNKRFVKDLGICERRASYFQLYISESGGLNYLTYWREKNDPNHLHLLHTQVHNYLKVSEMGAIRRPGKSFKLPLNPLSIH